MTERLKRFNKKASDIDASSGFCDNKRETDKLLAAPLTLSKAMEMGVEWLTTKI